ncbi:MAG: hypothetical protein MGU50_15735 [Trichodesmium sp. MAG_R02]|nr:hypothetical protein [Trichodesmium sp. MAG_R02]
MHATSLQGFGYGDVVHQFEKRCKPKKMWFINLKGAVRVELIFEILNVGAFQC